MRFFHFPKTLWGFLAYLILFVFFIGLLPFTLLLYINVFSFPIIKDVVNTVAWQWLLWSIELAVAGGTTILGIWVAFEFNRRYEDRKNSDSVLQVFPYVYFEIVENYLILKNTPIEEYESKPIRLKDTYWNIYKNEICKWIPFNIVNTKLYYDINRFNSKLDSNIGKTFFDDNRPKARLDNAITIIDDLKKLIEDKFFIKFDDWIKKTEVEHNYMKAVLDEYENYDDESIRAAVEYIKNKNLF